MAARTGFEPVISRMKTWYPRPLDDRALFLARFNNLIQAVTVPQLFKIILTLFIPKINFFCYTFFMKQISINKALKVSYEIYGIPNDRRFSVQDLLYYIQKYLFLYLNSSQKKNSKKTTQNLAIAFSWFLALINRYHIDLEHQVWKRFPYKCPLCLSIPCECRSINNATQFKTGRPPSRMPESLDDWQLMFKKIYQDKNLDELNIKFLQKLDNLIRSTRLFIKEKAKKHFFDIEKNSADFFSFFFRTFNLLSKSLEKQFVVMHEDGCYECHKTPCICNFY